MLRPPPPATCGANCVDLVGSVWKPRLTPGTSAARLPNWRPFSGRFSIWAADDLADARVLDVDQRRLGRDRDLLV